MVPADATQPTDGWRIYARQLPRASRSEELQRGARIVDAFGRRVVPALARVANRRGGADALVAVAHPLRLAFEELGGTFVKFGQIVASSPGLFGPRLSEEFRSCLDTGPAIPPNEVRAFVEDELGMRLEDAFAEFDLTPIGRASIAVVHRGRLHDGRVVAVKVLRPGIDRRVAIDLALMQPLFTLLCRATGAQVAGAMLQQLDALEVQIGEELDLRNEARALERFGALIKQGGFNALVVPEPIVELSTQGVLTMTYLEGTAIDDLTSARSLGVDPAPLVDESSGRSSRSS